MVHPKGEIGGKKLAPQGPKIAQKWPKNAPQAPPGPGGTILGHFGDQKKIEKKLKIPAGPPGPPDLPQGPKTLIFLRFFNGWSQKP